MAVKYYEEGTEESNEFEVFRQGRAELRTYGDRPANRLTFHRSKATVEFVDVEDRLTE